MRHFAPRNGVMHAEDVPLDQLAAEVGTPLYCYSTATLERHYRVFREAFGARDVLVAFAVKANSNLGVIRTLADLGAGADVVSGGELARARAAGVLPERIVFSGVGKTADEMAQALDAGIYQINVESEEELDLLAQVAASKGVRPAISFRLNPDVDAKTHAKISTGKAENKFGIPWERTRAVYAKAASLGHAVTVVGAAVHIGSQITDLAPLEAAFTRMIEMVGALRADGHALTRLDLGGGLGIPYLDDDNPPLPRDYAAMVTRLTDGLGVRLMFEPGRLIVGNAGVLLTRVLYVKKASTKTFVIVDAAMNDLIRPSLYDAYHAIEPVAPRPGPLAPVTLVGPVCETGDTFATDRPLPPLEPGDLLAFHSAGAYGAVMASTYNTRPLIPEVLVRRQAHAVVRPRVSVETLIGLDKLPDWTAPSAG
jgi:diaminopimelate decarboxylase